MRAIAACLRKQGRARRAGRRKLPQIPGDLPTTSSERCVRRIATSLPQQGPIGRTRRRKLPQVSRDLQRAPVTSAERLRMRMGLFLASQFVGGAKVRFEICRASLSHSFAWSSREEHWRGRKTAVWRYNDAIARYWRTFSMTAFPFISESPSYSSSTNLRQNDFRLVSDRDGKRVGWRNLAPLCPA